MSSLRGPDTLKFELRQGRLGLKRGDHKKLIILGELLAEHWVAGSAGSWLSLPCLPSSPLKDIQETLTFDLLDIPCAPLY